MTFPCTQCGACCRRIHLLSSELDRGDGACLHLVEHEDGRATCGIYDTRPVICRVDDLYEDLHRVYPAVSRDDYYRANHRICAEWQEQDGTAIHLRIVP